MVKWFVCYVLLEVGRKEVSPCAARKLVLCAIVSCSLSLFNLVPHALTSLPSCAQNLVPELGRGGKESPTMGGLFSCCQDRVPSSLILQDHGKWVQPCDDVAKTATRFYSSHHDDFTIRATKTSDLSEFGEGHTLYFYFLKWFSFLFLFLFVLTGLPSLIFNALGGYYEV